MFKDAKQLAAEAMKSRLSNSKDSEISPEFIDQVLEYAWMHQSDPEPRKRIRETLKDHISKAAILQARQGDQDEN